MSKTVMHHDAGNHSKYKTSADTSTDKLDVYIHSNNSDNSNNSDSSNNKSTMQSIIITPKQNECRYIHRHTKYALA